MNAKKSGANIENSTFSRGGLEKPLSRLSSRAVHSIWLLLKTGDDFKASAISASLKNVLSKIDRALLATLLRQAVHLGFLEARNDAFVKTALGNSFARSSHWRSWSVPSEDKRLFEEQGISHYFLGAKKLDQRPLVINLFAGAGGLSVAFEAAGFRVGVSVDNDPEACVAHRKNFPDSHVVEGDIVDLSKKPKQLLCAPFGIDPDNIAGIVGGPPCQGFSFMGERDTGDERNLLTSRFMDIVLGLQPDFFVMENVAGLLSSGRAPAFCDFIARLAKPIGEPAADLAEKLPKIAAGVAKRERQFKKRLVSSIVLEFKAEFWKVLTKENGKFTGKHLEQGFKLLSKSVSNALVATYSEQAIAEKIVRSSSREIGEIVLGALLEFALSKSFVSKKETKTFLSKICEASSHPIFKSSFRGLIERQSEAPEEVIWKGKKLGPVLHHLIQRACKDYEISAPEILNAAQYGSPQARQRLFLVGIHRRKKLTFEFPLPSSQVPEKKTMYSSNLAFAPTTSEAIGDLPDVDAYPNLIKGDAIPSSELSKKASPYAHELRGDFLDQNDFSLPRAGWDPTLIDCCKRTLHPDDGILRMQETPEGKMEDVSHRTKLNRNRVSHTLRAGTREGKGSHTAVRPIHYDFPRVVTVREGARLMGYPDWMTFHPTKWHGFRLVGNGVPREVGRAIASQLLNLLYKRQN